MDIFFNALCCIAAFFAFCLSIVRFMHFFQLNSYRASIQLRWMKVNISKLISNILFGTVGFAAALRGGAVMSIIFVFAMLLGMLFSIPQRAKKPLVYTARVKRMLVTCAVIYAAALVSGAVLRSVAAAAALCFAFAPLFVIFANLINKPVEKAIANRYINEAKELLKSSNAKVIGITGSYGKTSVKYYLATLLKAKYNVLMTPESYNTPMGIVKTVRGSLSPLHEIFICEMGAKRVGEIKEICDIVSPDYGLITAIGPQHLETFKSLDNVKKTKFELADSLGKGGILFLNGSDENINAFMGERANISYTLNGSGSYNASDVSVSERGTEFTVTAPDGESMRFSTRLIGRHNVLNITGAIAAAHTLGVSFSQLKIQVMRLESVPHRLELISRGKDIIIDDAYNSNPSGTKAALETLSYFEGVKILLTPGMVELGVRQDELNREFGENAARVCDYCILVGKRQTESILAGLAKAGFDSEKIYVASDLNDAIAYAYALNTHNERKIILLENDLPDNY